MVTAVEHGVVATGAEIAKHGVVATCAEVVKHGVVATCAETVEMAAILVVNTVDNADCKTGNFSANCCKDPAAAGIGLDLLLVNQY